jgi:hypothetical protein
MNLPATVEMYTPNLYADTIEWFLRTIRNRDSSPVAAPAQRPGLRRGRRRAGGAGRRRPRRGLPVRQRRAHRQRRPGHAGDQPVQPGRRSRSSTSATSTRCAEPPSTATACRCTSATPTSATSSTRRSAGSHQDAIKKGFAALYAEADEAGRGRDYETWGVPYLPIDPPTSAAPTKPSSGSTASPARAAWPTSWRPSTASPCRAACRSSSPRPSSRSPRTPAPRSRPRRCGTSSKRCTYPAHRACGCEATGWSAQTTTPRRSPHSATAVAYVETVDAHNDVRWGIGRHHNISTASLLAVLSAAERILRDRDSSRDRT